MTDSSQKPLTPNYVPDVGRLVTDRFDFQQHVNGTAFRHQANQIDLSPSLTVASVTYHNAQDILAALAGLIVPPTVPLATNSTTGIIRLAGDLNGSGSTALAPKVSGIQGFPINTTPPVSGNVLGWNGTSWGPTINSPTGSAGGDLRGTYPNPLVKSIAGPLPSVGLVTLLVGDTLSDLTITPPITTRLSGVGAQLSILAQDAKVGSGSNGGQLYLQSGTKDGIGLHGEWWITDVDQSTYIHGVPNTDGSPPDGNLFVQASSRIFIGTEGDGLLVLGASAISGGVGGGLQFPPHTIPLSPTSGSMALTPAQYKFPYLRFTGTLTGHLLIVLPAHDGATWYIDTTQVVFGGHEIDLNVNSLNWGTPITSELNIYRVVYNAAAGFLFGSTLTS